MSTPLNPHAWRKARQAERNMMRCILRRGRIDHRNGRKWARVFQKWTDKLVLGK